MSNTKKLYVRKNYGKKQVAAAPPFRSHFARDTPILPEEIRITARRPGICSACGCQTMPPAPIYWVPQTGLARHTQCAPSSAYNEALAQYRQDRDSAEREAAQTQLLSAMTTVLNCLRRPEAGALRRKLINRLQRIEAEAEMERRARRHLRLVK